MERLLVSAGVRLRHLAICRIVAVAAQLLWFFPNLDEHVNLIRKNSGFIDPQVLIRAISAIVPPEKLFTPGAITAIYWGTAAVGLLALVGLFTRVSLFLFAAGSWFFVAHLFSYGDRHHTEALFCIYLLLLAFAPSGERLSLDALIRRRSGRVEDGETCRSWPSGRSRWCTCCWRSPTSPPG